MTRPQRHLSHTCRVQDAWATLLLEADDDTALARRGDATLSASEAGVVSDPRSPSPILGRSCIDGVQYYVIISERSNDRRGKSTNIRENLLELSLLNVPSMTLGGECLLISVGGGFGARCHLVGEHKGEKTSQTAESLSSNHLLYNQHH